jgi:hypothetical protein
MTGERRLPPPGSVVSKLRRSLRYHGVKRAARMWGLHEREALELAAGLRISRATVLAAVRHQLARLEARDG